MNSISIFNRSHFDSRLLLNILSMLALILMFVDPAFAGVGGGGFQKIDETANKVVDILIVVSVVVVTAALLWAGYKMIFGGARFADVANILIGGTIIGGASAFASFIVN